jgi:hypothetical protein
VRPTGCLAGVPWFARSVCTEGAPLVLVVRHAQGAALQRS